MHFMLLSHDLAKSPGSYRTGPIFVHDVAAGAQVYAAPDAVTVAGLVDELVASLADDATTRSSRPRWPTSTS